MWARKRLDIRGVDLAFGIFRSLFPPERDALQQRVEQVWSASGDALACLSVRSGFDLLLAALQLPPKSEVLISAVTIPDMVRILEGHDLVPLPIDLDPHRMAPTMESLRQAITPATRAIIVAHLFGMRIPLDGILALANEHGLFVIEDCAQAFDGGQYHGHPDTQVSMFSFGSIKSSTAAGGGLLRVRDRELLRRMRDLQGSYPVQSRWEYLRRLLKCSALKAMATRPVTGMVVHGCRAARFDYDRLVNGAVRGFPGPGLFLKIRRQPSAPLLAVLGRRLTAFDRRRLAEQISKGRLLVELLDGKVLCPGGKMDPHTYWVFPILVDNPHQVIATLREKGYDATQGQSMCVVHPPDDRPELEASAAGGTLPRIVYLPFYPEMPAWSVKKMAQVLLRNYRPPAAAEPKPEEPVCG